MAIPPFGSPPGAPKSATYITQTANAGLSAEQALSALATGIMKVTTTTGVVSSVLESTFAKYADARFFIGTTTRDVTTASGTQAVTGVGFVPKVVIFLLSIDSTNQMSVGFSDGSVHMTLFDQAPVGAGQYGRNTALAGALIKTAAFGDYTTMTASSMDADGFTMTWTKVGSPTGTATVMYLALR